MGSRAAQLSFYTVTTAADLTPTETLLHEDIEGALETERQIVSDNPAETGFVQLLIFYPKEILTGIGTGSKAIDSDGNEYRVQYEETYSDHQEIHLRK